MLPIIYKEKLRFDISGERFSYSNSGMIILGAIIEKVTGQSYSDYITKNIFVPAKMYDTQMRFGDEVVSEVLVGCTDFLIRYLQKKLHRQFTDVGHVC